MQSAQESERERETSFNHGHTHKKKNHNTGGVKFQRALVVQSYIPAKGMCVQGVRGAACHQRAINVPFGPPRSNWHKRREVMEKGYEDEERQELLFWAGLFQRWCVH